MTDATEQLERLRLRLSQFEFEIDHQAIVKHCAKDELIWFSRFIVDDFQLEDDVLVLMTAEIKPEGGNNETDMEMWHNLYCHDGIEIVKPATLQTLQMSDGPVNEKRLTACVFPTDPHRREIAITVGKPGSFHSNGWGSHNQATSNWLYREGCTCIIHRTCTVQVSLPFRC